MVVFLQLKMHVLSLWTLKHKPPDIKKEVRLSFISGAGLLLFFHMILC